MVSRMLVASVLAVSTMACGSGIKEIDVLPAPSPLKAVADSTANLVSYAAIETDTAMVKTRVAGIARTLGDARDLVLGARSAVANAGTHVASAMRQGDWLRNVVATEARGDDFAKYWSIGRVKLDEARARTSLAVAAADSVLACTEQGCAVERTRLMQQHVEAAAGAAREAESVVRVALVHVK